MNERIKELAEQANLYARSDNSSMLFENYQKRYTEKFVELIVKEMCGMMEQAEDDCYHCFDPSERPTEYISWLNEWRKRFEQHFGVEE
jgi:hypothetical protein